MNCYVCHPSDGSILPEEVMNKDITLFYPESRMSTMDCFLSTRPRDFHIVTDNPFLVSLYSKHEVFIWSIDNKPKGRDRGKWVNPDFQTYGCSYEIIIDRIFKYTHSIPQSVIDSSKTTNCMGFNKK